MKPFVRFVFLLGILVLFSGCLATPVARTGGPGSLTIENTNPHAILNAARRVFAEYGFTPARGNFPDTIAFERPAGRAGTLAFGSLMQTTSFRVRIDLLPIPGTNDFRLRTHVDRVQNANVAGFEDSTGMLRIWSSQFTPLLRKVREQSENAGPWR